MDNISHALFLAFAIFALVIGLSFSVYLLGSLNSVATSLIQSTDKTRTYQSVSYDSSRLLSRGAISTGLNREDVYKTRTVSVDTVISTIYRYMAENFSVEIYSKNNDGSYTLNQVFDIELEKAVHSGDYSKLYYAKKQFNEESIDGDTNQCYMFNAPWETENERKLRIDLYVSSKKAYFNGTLVDYETGGRRGLKNMINSGSSNFLEEYIQYVYSGETYTAYNGDDIETITGNIKEQKRIIIRYKQL